MKTFIKVVSTLTLAFVHSSFMLAGAQRLTSADWPFPAMPSQEEQEANPSSRAYAMALETWLEQNPGVSLEQIELNIWEQQPLQTAVAGGTAPTFFPGQTLGGWSHGGTLTAMSQGLMADVTELFHAYGIDQKLPEPARSQWQEDWQVDGRYYGVPVLAGNGSGIYYRKDLIAELGLEEPQPGWTWDDFRMLAKALTTDSRKGAVLPSWILPRELATNGFSVLTVVPAPETSWNWRWDYTSNIDLWASIIERWREMIFEDQSVIYGYMEGGEALAVFLRGDAAMTVQNTDVYSFRPSQPNSASVIADRLGRPLDEVVGFVEMPRGDLDTLGFNNTAFFFVSFDPDASPVELDKAVSLVDFMYYGDGWIIQRQAEYEQFGDPRYVFNEPLHVSGIAEIPGIPGSFAETWGEDFVERYDSAVRVPRPPATTTYFPIQTETGPAGTAFDDALSALLATPDPVDIAAEFSRAEQVMNRQAASFRSSVSDDVFIESAREYYAALTAFYQEHSPEFYAQVFRPWHDAYVAPVLSE